MTNDIECIFVRFLVMCEYWNHLGDMFLGYWTLCFSDGIHLLRDTEGESLRSLEEVNEKMEYIFDDKCDIQSWIGAGVYLDRDVDVVVILRKLRNNCMKRLWDG